MRPRRWFDSVVTRLAVSFCLGGLVLSVALGLMSYRQTERQASEAAAVEMAMMARSIQDVLGPLVARGADEATIRSALSIFQQDPRVIGLKYIGPEEQLVCGDWPVDSDQALLWRIQPGHAEPNHRALDLSRQTVLTSTFRAGQLPRQVSLLIDGPSIQRQVRRVILDHLAMQWLLLAMLTLFGLMAMRRWFTGPLTRLGQLVENDADGVAFQQAGEVLSGEMGDLARTIGSMLHRIDEMTAQLRQRERAFEHLFQFAPAAILSIDGNGLIIEANHRAADLLGAEESEQLIHRPILPFVREADRGLFRQSIDRLELDQQSRCELQLIISDMPVDVVLELAAVHDESGMMRQVRLGIVDVTESRRLMSEVSEQRQLLDLVIDHMSDAILLVGIDRRIIQANHRLLRMLTLRLDNVTGQRYDPATFWSPLGLVDSARAFDRMGQLLDQPGTAAQEQYEADDGTYQFQVIPVCDEIGNAVAQLWVVQEVSAQLRSARMIEQQTEQLRAIQQMGRALHEVSGVDHLLDQVAAQLYQVMDVEAVGIALRQDDRQRRCAQRLQLAGDQTRLAAGSSMAEAVYRQLMPRVLNTRDTNYWADLSQQSDWAGAFTADGIEALAATLLHMEERSHGVIWIGRRGGRRIERHHLYLLEALAPIISNSLENAQLRQRMTALKLTDAVTALPAGEQFDLAVRKLVNRPGEPWSLLLIDIDHFQQFNDHYGHEAADQVLRQVAGALRDICRASDQACRLRADQFAVLCASTTVERAGDLAERIRGHIGQMSLDDLVPGDRGRDESADRPAPTLTCSIGIAASPTDHTAGDVLLGLAESRLQAAKAAGRNRIGDATILAREAG